MEGIKFELKISFLYCVRRAIARHLLLPLGVISFVAGAACHAASPTIESHSWKAALERVPCLRATRTPEGYWLVSGIFIINGEHFSDPIIRDAAFIGLFKTKCATGAAGSSDANTSGSGGQASTGGIDHGPSGRGSFEGGHFNSNNGGSVAGTGGGLSANTPMFSGTNIAPTYIGDIEATVAVPFPMAGAGFPGLIAACGALAIFARIRRKKVMG
jgi:hypothetical protein